MSRSAYPTREGAPINPIELGLTTFEEIELARQHNRLTIHHHDWPSIWYQPDRKLKVEELDTPLSVLRNLYSRQFEMPDHRHNNGRETLHTMYEPPKLPSKEQALRYIWNAFVNGNDPIVIGSINNREYHPITEERMIQLFEWNPKAAKRAIGYSIVNQALSEGRILLDVKSIYTLAA